MTDKPRKYAIGYGFEPRRAHNAKKPQNREVLRFFVDFTGFFACTISALKCPFCR